MLLVAGRQIPLALVWCAGSGWLCEVFGAALGATARWRGKNTVLVPIVDFYNIISWESTFNSIRRNQNSKNQNFRLKYGQN